MALLLPAEGSNCYVGSGVEARVGSGVAGNRLSAKTCCLDAAPDVSAIRYQKAVQRDSWDSC